MTTSDLDAGSIVDGATAPVDGGAPADAGVVMVDGGVTAEADGGVVGDGCATAPTGDWSGMARREFGGSAGSDEWKGDVRWNLGTSEACVDRYWPSGTFTFSGNSGSEGDDGDFSTRAIEPDEGVMVIDRSTAPATYRMVGPPSGGGPTEVWVDHEGWFNGSVIAGRAGDDENSVEGEWHFTRVDAVFTPPATGCSELPQEQWRGEYEIDGSLATVTWSRVTTDGCVDRYRAEGTVFFPDGSNLDCAVDDYEPNTGTIDPEDGELVIDRSTDPARFRVEGFSQWPATRTCTYQSGKTQTFESSISARWADSGSTFLPSGGFDGTDHGVRVELDEVMRWSLRRGP